MKKKILHREDGKPAIEYKNGLKYFYAENGIYWREVVYRDEDDIFNITYYVDNKISKVEYYKNGNIDKYQIRQDHQVKYYDLNGNLLKISCNQKNTHYEDDGKGGTRISYIYKDGCLKEEYLYKKNIVKRKTYLNYINRCTFSYELLDSKGEVKVRIQHKNYKIVEYYFNQSLIKLAKEIKIFTRPKILWTP